MIYDKLIILKFEKFRFRKINFKIKFFIKIWGSSRSQFLWELLDYAKCVLLLILASLCKRRSHLLGHKFRDALSDLINRLADFVSRNYGIIFIFASKYRFGVPKLYLKVGVALSPPGFQIISFNSAFAFNEFFTTNRWMTRVHDSRVNHRFTGFMTPCTVTSLSLRLFFIFLFCFRARPPMLVLGSQKS